MGEIDAQYDVNLHSVLLIRFWSFNISGIPTDFRVDVGAMTLDSTHPQNRISSQFSVTLFCDHTEYTSTYLHFLMKLLEKMQNAKRLGID